MHASNWKKKTTRSVKKNKSNFINVIGDKFVMSIRSGKLIISFCKKLFTCVNAPGKHQETYAFLMYFRKYRK